VRWKEIAGRPERHWRERSPSGGSPFRPGLRSRSGHKGPGTKTRCRSRARCLGRICEALVDLLRPFSSSPCWFVLWDGSRGLRVDPRQVWVPWLGNDHLEFRGSLEAVTRFDWTGWWQPPQLWLPDDRRWCVGTEIDDYATHIGGSNASSTRSWHQDAWRRSGRSRPSSPSEPANGCGPSVRLPAETASTLASTWSIGAPAYSLGVYAAIRSSPIDGKYPSSWRESGPTPPALRGACIRPSP
jgi:hypothetical protein